MTHEELVINPPFSWNNKNIGAFQALMLARVQISCILMCVIDIGLGVREPRSTSSIGTTSASCPLATSETRKDFQIFEAVASCTTYTTWKLIK